MYSLRSSFVFFVTFEKIAALTALALILGLQGCATTSIQPVLETQKQPAASIDHFNLSGRVGVQYEQEGYSGSLKWQHRTAEDDLLILSPLGQGIARIQKNASGISLTTAGGQTFQAPDAESLTQQALGWRLPLEGMQYWVLGLPSPKAPFEIEKNAQHITRLRQQGWQIDYLSFKNELGALLPAKIVLQQGTLEIKLIIDKWER